MRLMSRVICVVTAGTSISDKRSHRVSNLLDLFRFASRTRPRLLPGERVEVNVRAIVATASSARTQVHPTQPARSAFGIKADSIAVPFRKPAEEQKRRRARPSKAVRRRRR